MKLRVYTLSLLLWCLFAPAPSFAQTSPAQTGLPTQGLLFQLVHLADPDQVEAFTKLKLSHDQIDELSILGRSYVPTVKALKGDPAKLMRLVPEAWGKVEALLTPEQRPLARKLLPRPHQWSKLRAVYQNF